MLKYKLLIVSLFCAVQLMAQMPQFSQYYANSLYLSPAFAGAEHNTRGILASRYQWPGLAASYITHSFSVDHYFSDFNSGVGLIVKHDHINPSGLKTTDIGLSYSYEVGITKNLVFRPGIQAAYVHRTIDMSQLMFGSQYTDNGYIGGASNEGLPENSVSYLDFAAGGLILSEQFWAGMSLHHLNQPNQSFLDEESTLPTKISFFGGYKFMLTPDWKRRYVSPNKEVSISPTLMYKMQGKSDQLDLGLYGRYNNIITGIWYRSIPVKVYSPDRLNHDALVFLVGLIINDLHVGYSFDVTTSKLTMESWGSHELTLSYRIRSEKAKKDYQKRPACPQF